MSVAFTREDSAETAAEVDLPDRPVSPHANLVTKEGLDHLSKALADARDLYDRAGAIEDVNERRRAAAPALRDARYYMKRLQSAQLVAERVDHDTVAFGSRVTFTRDDGRQQTFRVVGEDEAEPRNGTISYVSPIARALHGKSVGDIVALGDQELEIIAIA
jgi:transcription elongation GreA/GreB family factor